MAQSKEEKNRKARERRARLKEKGLSNKQIRNLGKAIKEEPDLLTKVSNFAYKLYEGIAESVGEAADTITNAFNGVPTFDEFVAKSPTTWSARKLKAEYRKIGGKVGNAKGNKTIREVKAKPFDYKRSTRQRQGTIKYYPPKHNPRHKNVLVKTRFSYYVSYYVRVDEFAEPDNRFATILSERKLDAEEVMDALFMMFNEQSNVSDKSKEERYKGLEIVDDDSDFPIRILYAIDKNMK
ncbi:hypothetical protein D3C81_375440 [compost metagenome]